MNIPLVTDLFALIMRSIMTLITNNFGVAIIIFAFITKALVFPLQLKSKKGMLDQQRIAPKMAELEKKHKGDKQKYTEAVQKLYKDEGVSMLGGCLPTILVLVVVLGLYGVVYRPVSYLMTMNANQVNQVAQDIVDMDKAGMYLHETEKSEIWIETLGKQVETKKVNELNLAQALGGNLDSLTKYKNEATGENRIPYDTSNMFEIRFPFLGLDLGEMPSYRPINLLVILPILSALSAFGMSWLTQKYNNPAGAVQTEATANAAKSAKTMIYFMPLMSLFIGFALPAGVTLYWIVNNIASAIQEPLLMKVARKKYGKGLPEHVKEKKPAIETTGTVKNEETGGETPDNKGESQ